MQIGFPNHPRRDIIEEIRWIGENGFDFIDIFLEADRCEAGQIDAREVKKSIDGYGLDRTGHTAWYLPLGSPDTALRTAAADIVRRHLDIFARLECRKVTVHAYWPPGYFSVADGVRFQAESLRMIAAAAGELGIRIMLEPGDTVRDSAENIRQLLDAVPGLLFHADIGHLNLFGRDICEYLEVYCDSII